MLRARVSVCAPCARERVRARACDCSRTRGYARVRQRACICLCARLRVRAGLTDITHDIHRLMRIALSCQLYAGASIPLAHGGVLAARVSSDRPISRLMSVFKIVWNPSRPPQNTCAGAAVPSQHTHTHARTHAHYMRAHTRKCAGTHAHARIGPPAPHSHVRVRARARGCVGVVMARQQLYRCSGADARDSRRS